MVTQTPIFWSRYWLTVRCAIALVWLYQGLYLKIIAVHPQHLAIAQKAISFLPGRFTLTTIGLIETSFALGLIIRFFPRALAWIQIIFLGVMNLTGILSAKEHIPDSLNLLTMNFVFALAILGAGYASKK